MVLDFSFSKLLWSSLKTALGGFCRSISPFVLFPSLVCLSSSSPVYLFLFWIPWVPSGHCLSPLPHFFGWNSVERILAVGSYCSDFRVIRVCLAGIQPLYHSFDLPYTCPIMRTSSGPNRSSGLRLGGRPNEEFESRRTGSGSGSLAVVVDRAPPADHPSPFDKGKGKVSEIRYPSGSEYLKAAVKYADAVGPSRVSPFMTFITRYRPPLGVQVWCPDLLTSYIFQVPKMVCFFEAAFENGLRFPLHPFIKNVLQHFNVWPSQLSPNFGGVLVGLLVVFRDKGLEVPSIALLLDFFSVKEAAEGFFCIFLNAPIPSRSSRIFRPPINTGRNVIFSLVVLIGSIILLTEKIRLAFRSFGLLPRTYVSFRSR